MNDGWTRLLDALIAELEWRRSVGQRFITLPPDGWTLIRSLAHPAALPAAALELTRPGPAGSSIPAMPSTVTPGALGLHAKPRRTPTDTAPPAAAKAPAQATAWPGRWSGPSPGGLSREARLAAFAALRERVLQCRRCPHLAATRKNVVFGVGNPEAELVFVGEAPGVEEDEQGEPFVGPAGQLLTRIIQAMGFTRDQVYIANILKCRPDTPGQTSGNRKPTPTEMATCFPYLREQLELIRPKVIVALGATAVEGLLGKLPTGITRLRGQWQQWQGIPVMPTYHPAYLLRNQALAEKRKVWEDMLQVLERLGRPITERQRNYFTRTTGERA